MDLAKPCIDVGLNTARPEPMLSFWRDVIGLAYEGPLPIRPGLVQHRFACDGSIVKINAHAAAPPAGTASGYREGLVARPGLSRPVQYADTDGNAVRLWPAGVEGLGQLGVRLRVRDLAAHRAFGWRSIMRGGRTCPTRPTTI